MKTSLALTLLSTKLTLLLCVSCMGLFGAIESTFAQDLKPCHEVATTTEDNSSMPCDMCSMALEAWDQKAVYTEAVLVHNNAPLVFDVATTISFLVPPTGLKGVYHLYYPPPLALLKSVTPNTKTTVLIV